MNNNPGKITRRRKFLKSGLRTLLLGGIAFVGGLLGWRELSSAENETVCVITSPCRNCAKYTYCTNPKAVASEQEFPSKQWE
ncbi:hypothetical protein ACFL4V_00295 [Candidatus Latescibacterota bacterium]